MSNIDRDCTSNENINVIGTGSEYVGGGMKLTFHGFSYQIKLLMLYIIRGLKQTCKFEIATEVEAADKLDDLLFLYEKDEIGFLQAKHKVNEDLKITGDQLLKVEGAFSIKKYFDSYNQILNERELTNVIKDRNMILIINTTISIDRTVPETSEPMTPSFLPMAASSILSDSKILALSTKEEREKFYVINEKSDLYEKLAHMLEGLEQPPIRVIENLAKAVVNNKKKSIKVDELFLRHREWFLANVLEIGKEDYKTQTRHFVTFRDSFLSGSDKSVSNLQKIFINTYLSQEETGKDDTTSVQKDLSGIKFQIPKKFALPSKNKKGKVQTFLDRVVFAIEQINEIKLGDVIEKEIGEYMGHTNRQSIACKFQSYIQDWAKQKEGRFLTNEDVEQQFAVWGYETLNQLRVEDIKKHKCAFKKSNEVIKKLSNYLNTENDANVFCLYNREMLFSKIKVCQVLETFCSENIDQQFILCDIRDLIELENTKMCPVKAFSSQICNTLFVSLEDCELCNAEVEILHGLLQIVIESNQNAEQPHSNVQRKRLIITVPEEKKSEFITKIGFNTYGIKSLSLNDLNNRFSELDEKSRRQLMENFRIKLHGNYITGLLSENELALCIRDEMFLKLISNELEINNALVVRNQYNEEVRQYYVNRSLVPVIVGQGIAKDSQFYIVREYTPQMNIQNREVVVVSSDEKLFVHFRKTTINVHWLEEINNKYIWITSQGTVTKLRKYVTRQDLDLDSDPDLHLDPGLSSEIDLVSDSDFNLEYFFDSSLDSDLDLDSEPKNCIPVTNVSDLNNDVVLISASPGMGKSILLSHIAEQSKKEDTSFFIVKTNLADNLEELDNLKKEENVTLKQATHFAFIATQIESPQIERSESAFNLLTVQDDGSIAFTPDKRFGPLDHLRAMVFCNLYNKEKIVLLLDGFDEIAPDYCETTLKLLQTLKHSKVRKMWVTTRPYGATKDLENYLETFAYTLKPLSKKDQLIFFLKFWRHKIKSRHTEILSSLKNFLSSLNTSTLSAIHKAGRKQNPYKKSPSFVSVPLHCYMLVKVLTKDFIKFCSQNIDEGPTITPFTIYDLYSKFFDIKFDEILHNENLKHPKNISLLEEKKKVKSDHGKLALLQIFDKELLAELVPDKDRIKLINSVRSGNEKIGIVTEIVGNKPQFVHRTYTEYFAAHYLAQVLLDPVKKERKEAAKSLLYNCVIGNLEYYYTLFTFFNYNVISGSNNKDVFEAAIGGNIRKLSEIDNVNEIFDPLYRTPMHLVAINLCNVLKDFLNLYRNADLSTATTMHNYCQTFIQRLCQSMRKRSSDSLFTWTPAHYLTLSVCKEIWETFPFLIHYFNDGTPDTLGRTPLMLAIIKNPDIYDWIRICSPVKWKGVNVQDKFSKTALHYVLGNFKVHSSVNDDLFRLKRIFDMICFLLKYGARFDIADNRGNTPVDIINSVLSKIPVDTLEALSNFHKGQIDNYNMDDIYQTSWNYITEHVQEHLIGFEVDTPAYYYQNTCCCLQYPVEIESCEQYVNNKSLLWYTLLHQLIRDYDKPILPVPDSEVFTLWHVDKFSPEIAELLIETTDLHTLSTDNDNHKSLIVFFLTMTETIAPILLSKFPHFADVVDSRGRTALHYAVQNKNKACVTFLIKGKARVDIPDNTGKMPAHIKKLNILNGINTIDKDKLLFINNLDLEVASPLVSTMNLYPTLTQVDADFTVYVLRNKMTVAHVLLSHYPDAVNTRDSKGRTALHYAVENEDKSDVCYLIDNNARADMADKDGKYPAQLEKDKPRYLKKMLNFINTLPFEVAKPLVLTMALFPPITPIDYVLLNDILDEQHTIASVLWAEYSDLLATNSLKDNCSYFDSAKVSNTVVCRLLTKYSIEDFSDKNVLSNEVLKLVMELFSSVRNNNLSRLKTIIKCVEMYNPIKYHTKSQKWTLPEYKTLFRGNMNDASCVVNARRKDDGKTALHYAAEIGEAEIVESLLSLGAYYNVPDVQGFTPSQIAKTQDNTAVLHLLDRVEMLFNCLDSKSSYDIVESLINDEEINRLLLRCMCFSTKEPFIYLAYRSRCYEWLNVIQLKTKIYALDSSSEENSSSDENSPSDANLTSPHLMRINCI